MDNNHAIVINSGSSSIKFAIYKFTPSLDKLLHGVIENLQIEPTLKLFDHQNTLIRQQGFSKDCDYKFFFELLFSALKNNQLGFNITVAGHRVVHGGNDFHAPTLVSPEIVQQLQKFIPFAPLHQPYNLEAITTISQLYPELKQVICFDTAFHTTHPPVANQFGLPRSLTEEGIKRYGFHGLSYEFIMHRLNAINTHKSQKRIVIAHLGNGASMCAVNHGKSLDSTMGFTAVDGLVMGTRCGNLDPGVILYLSQAKKMSPEEIQNLLYKQSGLLGVSGISSNMQHLLEIDSAPAKEAIDLFVYRIRRELGALSAVLGGLDVLVFTGGIGEHAWQIREAVCQNNAWLGIKLDPHANKSNQLTIHDKSSSVDLYVIPTDEEWVIANHCYQLINKGI
ncbi:acetate/propionate family kinase [Legionella cardiaca]|uniref:Acetate kinase n=1 Tax=Legionella cardiaca TaxID=1071983 RepID=A0ABY8ARQ5_9GAMM|nr:acetate/propionate family kinase [Legionella cardiaca]WED43352.1 acetate/propionate family kinase [Legionella cardiaca]